jgi:CheY-like chemotaxis protein
LIELRVRRRESQVEIAVMDSGRGIAPEFLPHVFDRFTQARVADHRNQGGLGLGLAIVRHLVEMHGGEVQADSAGEGLGATFTVTLPAESISKRRVQPDPEATAPKRDEHLDDVRVLFIDDNADARDLVATMLRDRGASVRTCESMDVAFEALRRERPDVLISDIEMPGGDGYEMIRALRVRDEDTDAPIPAIALTGTTRVEDRIRMLAAGFQIHVPKPVDPDELVTAVATLAAQHGGRRRGANRKI